MLKTIGVAEAKRHFSEVMSEPYTLHKKIDISLACTAIHNNRNN